MTPKRVFIVEDSSVLRQRINQDVDSIGGFQVVGFAETQDEAIAAITHLCPEIVITDLQLRAGTGLEVVRQASDSDCSPAPYIVVLTNYGYPEYKRQCLRNGAHEFFDKSSQYSEFLTSMQRLSQRRI